MLDNQTGKLSRSLNGNWVTDSPKPVFTIKPAHDGTMRVITTAPGSDPVTLESLASCLTPPLTLMYLLHFQTGAVPAGRYRSDGHSGDEVRAFLKRFNGFLTGDGRHDLRVYSDEDEAMIIWDRHNLVYAYGNSRAVVTKLRGLGFEEGEVEVPVPHLHHYYSTFDDDARAVIRRYDWSYSSLEPEDED